MKKGQHEECMLLDCIIESVASQPGPLRPEAFVCDIFNSCQFAFLAKIDLVNTGFSGWLSSMLAMQQAGNCFSECLMQNPKDESKRIS